MTKDNGGNAFPALYHDDTPGMTLRDWFAGQAIPAIIAATSAGQHNPGMKVPQGATIVEGMAHDAYELADAMLEARK